jgi:glyoxylase-like metal-dependent hydrolase (beta-lactamase superfamily II)
MDAERFHFNVGNYACIVFQDGVETVPITTLTDTITQEQLSKVLGDHGFSPTEKINYFNCLFIDTGERKILVDAGWGCCTQRVQGQLLRLLQIEGITPQDIALIIFTHGDRDHFAGIIDTDDRLVFPNPRYVMGKAAWDWYASDANLTRLPEEFGVLYRKVLPLIQDRVELADAEIEVLTGVQILPAPGHKPGHLALIISSAGEQLLHVADSIGHPILMEYPEWRWPADALPEQALQTRRWLFDWAVAQNCLVFGSHMPFPGLGHVTPHGDGWRWQPITTEIV